MNISLEIKSFDTENFEVGSELFSLSSFEDTIKVIAIKESDFKDKAFNVFMYDNDLNILGFTPWPTYGCNTFTPIYDKINEISKKTKRKELSLSVDIWQC